MFEFEIAFNNTSLELKRSHNINYTLNPNMSNARGASNYNPSSMEIPSLNLSGFTSQTYLLHNKTDSNINGLNSSNLINAISANNVTIVNNNSVTNNNLNMASNTESKTSISQEIAIVAKSQKAQAQTNMAQNFPRLSDLSLEDNVFLQNNNSVTCTDNCTQRLPPAALNLDREVEIKEAENLPQASCSYSVNSEHKLEKTLLADGPKESSNDLGIETCSESNQHVEENVIDLRSPDILPLEILTKIETESENLASETMKLEECEKKQNKKSRFCDNSDDELLRVDDALIDYSDDAKDYFNSEDYLKAAHNSIKKLENQHLQNAQLKITAPSVAALASNTPNTTELDTNIQTYNRFNFPSFSKHKRYICWASYVDSPLLFWVQQHIHTDTIREFELELK